MGRITILKETTKNPLETIGAMAGICWGSDLSSPEKNKKRGLDCIKSKHGRTWEFVEVYMVLEGWSARVMREFYTHIGGAPTRLQESTRYVDSSDFGYVLPPKIAKNDAALKTYRETMETISEAIHDLEELGIPREDSAMLLPLGMGTKVVVRMNLRTLVDMAHQRFCVRAYWEYRNLMTVLKEGLAEYSDEWNEIVDMLFIPKCEDKGFCEERFSCGHRPKIKEDNKMTISEMLDTIAQDWDSLNDKQKNILCVLVAGNK